MIRGLRQDDIESASADSVDIHRNIEQITTFTKDSLEGKKLSPGEEFWFTGAHGKRVQGWVLKPRGFKEGEKKKWPVVLLIHGGVRFLCGHLV
jgi:dipeptidyl aminopeptidase/acylaminoacyl peptidase